MLPLFYLISSLKLAVARLSQPWKYPGNVWFVMDYTVQTAINDFLFWSKAPCISQGLMTHSAMTVVQYLPIAGAVIRHWRTF